jgi:hypothetical protein
MLKHRTALIILFIAAALLLTACTKTQPPDTAEPPPPEETAAPAQASDELPTDSITKPTPLPEDHTQPDEEKPDEEDDEDALALPAPVTDENGFVWRVPPTLEYDEVHFCNVCDLFSTENHGGSGLDKKTGQIIEYTGAGHGGGNGYNFYDEKMNLYCNYSAYEGAVYFEMWEGSNALQEGSWSVNSIKPFQKIDSAKIKTNERADWTDYDFSEAYIDEKYALAYGITFVTDFIFDDFCFGDFRYRTMDKLAVLLDGNWGVIDKDGNTALPFCFEAIVFIDDDTAFAKYNGKYGILDITATMENTRNP